MGDQCHQVLVLMKQVQLYTGSEKELGWRRVTPTDTCSLYLLPTQTHMHTHMYKTPCDRHGTAFSHHWGGPVYRCRLALYVPGPLRVTLSLSSPTSLPAQHPSHLHGGSLSVPVVSPSSSSFPVRICRQAPIARHGGGEPCVPLHKTGGISWQPPEKAS